MSGTRGGSAGCFPASIAVMIVMLMMILTERSTCLFVDSNDR